MGSGEKFNTLLNGIINHPFLHYHPYLLDDDKIIQDAQMRAKQYSKLLLSGKL